MNVSHFSTEELQATLAEASGLMDVGALTPFEQAIAEDCCRSCVAELSLRGAQPTCLKAERGEVRSEGVNDDG